MIWFVSLYFYLLAIDRAFRIGQTKNVFVHKLVCSDTFEEKIDAMVEAKKEIANLTTETGGKLCRTIERDPTNTLPSVPIFSFNIFVANSISQYLLPHDFCYLQKLGSAR